MVLLKVISQEITANPEFRARFKQVATAASTLHHPNIAQVYEFSRSDDVEFVVMGALAGESVYDLLERERPQRRYLLRYASQIASALNAAHGAGIIHGPLNPANIFISPKRQIKIHDFGFGFLAPPPRAKRPAALDLGLASHTYHRSRYRLIRRTSARISSLSEPWFTT